MKCPRCQRESRDDAVFCPGCGAPLALRAEPAPSPLDASVSLDRRAGDRALTLELGDAERSASWDLGPPPAAPAAAGPSSGAAAPDDDLEDFQFGPLPELAGDLEPGAAPGALADAEAEPAGTEAPGSPFGSLHRALGLAADPVRPHDLGLGQDGEADASFDPGALDRDLDLGDPPGASAPPATFAAADRDLALAQPARAPGGARRPDLVLDLGREALAGPVGAVALASGSELDLALPAMARPDELRLPLPRVASRRRGARAGRRAASWAIDAAPFVALWVAALAAVYARVPVSPGTHASAWELVLRDGGAIARPLLLCVAILALVYQTLAHALAGATLGKWLFGLRLVGPDGARPSVGRSAARAALSAASVLVLGLGLLPALFTRSGRALHDISSGTRVVEAP